jgi:Glycosyltransferase family 10 (fucosyltransferase) C-term
MIQVRILCNWTSSEKITREWNKMTPANDFFWGNIQFVWSPPNWWNTKKYYEVVINGTNEPNPKHYKRIYFCMEPIDFPCNPSDFIRMCVHNTHINLIEWHISKTWIDLVHPPPIDKMDRVSIIISKKKSDIGHKKRIGLMHYLDNTTDILDVYGHNYEVKHYKGSLPVYQKDDGLIPYKYSIAVENNQKENYLTEKLIDCILSECLCFYWGCPNALEIIGVKDAWISLDLEDLSKDAETIQKAINNNEWERRIKNIRRAKNEILLRKNALSQIAQEIYRLEHP